MVDRRGSGKFVFQPYADPARWRHSIYKVIYEGQEIGSVAATRRGHEWVILLDTGGIEVNFTSRNAAAERLLVLSGLNPVANAALPDDPFDGLI